jgi:hypothetical protein
LSSFLNLRPRTLYFLQLLNESTGEFYPYIKVGVTEGTTLERINQLQTGNPFLLVAYAEIESEAADIVERYIHRLYSSKRHRLEWIRVQGSDLDEMIEEARRFSEEVSAKARVVRELDQKPSNGQMLAKTPEVEELCEDIQVLLRKSVEVSKRQDVVTLKLRSFVGTAMGIDGVAQVTLTAPQTRFQVRDFRGAHPELHEDYCRLPKPRCTFSFKGKPRIQAFPELRTALSQAKAALTPVAAEDVQPDKLGRSVQVEALHDEYLLLEKEKSEVEGDLLRFELELRHLCGVHEGITDVCTYKRDVRMTFDKESFQADHPEIWEQFCRKGEAQRRLTILKTRAYA